MTNTDKVFNYLLTNKDYAFTINQLVGNLNLTTNTVQECLNTLLQQDKVKTFTLNNTQYYKLKK